MTPPTSERTRDWISEAHFISRMAPGLGNPLDLTIVEFDEHLRLSASGGTINGSI